MFIIQQAYALIIFIAILIYLWSDPQKRARLTEEYLITLCVNICVAATIAAVSIMLRPPLLPF